MPMYSTVLGRVWWTEDGKYRCPWMSFPDRKAFHEWEAQVHEIHPGLKCEWTYYNTHTPQSILSSVRDKASREGLDIKHIGFRKTANRNPWQVAVTFKDRKFIKRRYFRTLEEARSWAEGLTSLGADS